MCFKSNNCLGPCIFGHICTFKEKNLNFLPRLFSQDSMAIFANQNGSLICNMILVFLSLC